MNTRVVSYGALLTALGIIIGAFGAHALKDSLSPYGQEIFKTASLYHLIHGLGLVGLGLLGATGMVTGRVLRWIAPLFIGGIFIFCGSLYLLAITEARWLGAITPIGGVAFIVGWLILGVGTLARSGSTQRIDNPPAHG